MTSGVIAVGWTFVLSPTYTVISLSVGVVTILFLTAVAIDRELRPTNGGKWAMAAMLLCFAGIVMLRLTDLAYQRPDSLSANAAAPTAQATIFPTQPAGLAALPASSQIYFAGGMSSPGEPASVYLLNPTTQITNVYLTFFLGAGLSATQTLSIPPTSQETLPVTSLEQFAGSFGLRVVTDKPIVAQLHLGRDGQADDLLSGNTRLSSTWYLARLRFQFTFHESIAILNPDPSQVAHVILHLNPQDEVTGLEVTETIAPHSQIVVPVTSLEPKEAVNMIVTADTPVAVTRTFTFGKNPSNLTTQVGSLTPTKSAAPGRRKQQEDSPSP